MRCVCVSLNYVKFMCTAKLFFSLSQTELNFLILLQIRNINEQTIREIEKKRERETITINYNKKLVYPPSYFSFIEIKFVNLYACVENYNNRASNFCKFNFIYSSFTPFII